MTDTLFSPSSALQEALKDLAEAKEEAREEEYPEPSDVAIDNAHRLLHEMYRMSPRQFAVYPTADGEIAVYAPRGYGHSVLLLCASDGSALCLVNMNGKGDRRARYSTANSLPDEFLREALQDLEQRIEQGHIDSR